MRTFVKWDAKALIRERNDEFYYIKILRTFHQDIKSEKASKRVEGLYNTQIQRRSQAHNR